MEKNKTHYWEVVLELTHTTDHIKIERCKRCAALCIAHNNSVKYLSGNAKSVDLYIPIPPVTCMTQEEFREEIEEELREEAGNLEISWGKLL